MNNKTINKLHHIYYTVSSSIGERLDMFLSAEGYLTRSHIQKLIKQGRVTVNNQVEKASYKVKEHDRISVTVPEESYDVLVPESVALDVVWEDDDILVINKPAHMVVYPAAGHRTGTLMNAIVSRCKKLSSIGAPLRPGVVHRLDKETSGLIVIAKNNKSHYSLVDQFKYRYIEKQYMVLIHGHLKEESGEIKKLIGRSFSDRKKMSTRTRSGKEAITRFTVLETLKEASLIKVKILTGRTHQIRVHLASIGNPVLGDKTYGRKTILKLGQRSVHVPRQMLHAFYLKLKHPGTGKLVEFHAPLPDDMDNILKELRHPSQ